MSENGETTDDGTESCSKPVVNLNVTDIQISQFAKALFLDRIAPGRISMVLLFQLYCCAHLPGAAQLIGDLPKIDVELRALEGNFLRSTGTKPAEQFTRPPLQGLWKKHYLVGGLRSYALNLKLGAGKKGCEFSRIVKTRRNPDIPPQEIAKNIAYDVGQIYADRSCAQQLTGEWIVFAKNEGKNYYLCLAGHNQGDEDIFRTIRDGCVSDFPFLGELLHL
jgi:hypothetical protein